MIRQRLRFGEAVAGLAIAALSSSCAGAPASALDRSTPLGTRIDRVHLEDVPVKGHRVSVTYGVDACIVEGELIAVTPDALIVLDEVEALWRVPTALLVEAELELYPSQSGSFYTATTVGSVSSLSHGYWLVISLPVWLAVGLPVASSESSASHLSTRLAQVPKLAAYARFPHGASMDWSKQARSADQCG